MGDRRGTATGRRPAPAGREARGSRHPVRMRSAMRLPVDGLLEGADDEHRRGRAGVLVADRPPSQVGRAPLPACMGTVARTPSSATAVAARSAAAGLASLHGPLQGGDGRARASTIVLSPSRAPRVRPPRRGPPRALGRAGAPRTRGHHPGLARPPARPCPRRTAAPPIVDTNSRRPRQQPAGRHASLGREHADDGVEATRHVGAVVAVADGRIELGAGGALGPKRASLKAIQVAIMPASVARSTTADTGPHTPQRRQGCPPGVPEGLQVVVQHQHRQRGAGHLERGDVAPHQVPGTAEARARSRRSTSP